MFADHARYPDYPILGHLYLERIGSSVVIKNFPCVDPFENKFPPIK